MPKMSRQTQPDYKALVDLLQGSMLMHLDAINIADWLQRFAAATDSNGTASLRWTLGNPDFCIDSSHGNIPKLPADIRALIDSFVGQSTRREPGFIEDFLTTSATGALLELPPLNDPRYLLAIVDWNPACIAVMMARTADRPVWSAADRKRIRTILPYVRESVLVHKKLDRSRYIAGLARDLLDKSPRGILVLSDDGIIRMANTRGSAILAENDGLSERDGKLTIACKTVTERVKHYLSKLGTMNNEGLPEMDWNMVVKKRSGSSSYQLILGHLKLSDWNIESRHSNKVAVLHLHDPDRMVGVQPAQLTDFYGFTKAQARLAAQLFQGHSINEAAEALHISVNTARTHMRGIYARTGVRTQAELLGILSTGLTSYGENIENS
jgi:DNA-binding CsgD family transcriptional regulator/PAS domain-containing protein